MSTSFCTQNYLLSCYDSRLISQLVSDTGYPADLTGNNNPVIAQLLSEATETIISAVEVGGRYDSSLLFPLSISTTSGFLLRRMTADLTFGLIQKRRGRAVTDLSQVAPAYVEALGILEKIKLGQWIFPGVNDLLYEEAGVPNSVYIDGPIPGQQYYPLLSQQIPRFFPGPYR